MTSMTPNHRTSFQNLPPREDSSAERAFNEFADEDVPAEYGYHVADSPGVTTPTGVPPRTARELMNGLYRTPGRPGTREPRGPRKRWARRAQSFGARRGNSGLRPGRHRAPGQRIPRRG